MRYRSVLNASRYSTDLQNRKKGLGEVSFSLGTHPGNGWAFPRSRSNSTRESCSCCGERKAQPPRRILSCRGAFTISDDRWRPDYSGKGLDLRSSRLSSITDLEIVRAWPAYINVMVGTRICARPRKSGECIWIRSLRNSRRTRPSTQHSQRTNA